MDFDRVDLWQLRERLRLTQAQMADAMGMPFRSYQAIETGQNPVRPIHAMAAKAVRLTQALGQADSLMLTHKERDQLPALLNDLEETDADKAKGPDEAEP